MELTQRLEVTPEVDAALLKLSENLMNYTCQLFIKFGSGLWFLLFEIDRENHIYKIDYKLYWYYNRIQKG